MLGTSRCFSEITSQLDGSDALAAVVRFLFLRAEFSCTRFTRILPEHFWETALSRKTRLPVNESTFHAIGKLGPSAHNLRGEVAARCVAVG